MVETQARRRDWSNRALVLLVMAPSVVAAWWIIEARPFSGLLDHPIAVVNVLFFLNVCVLFWVVALVQRSTWLIDPYWTLLPLFIAHFYAAHPSALTAPGRSSLALAVLWIWSIRLTGSYFRREGWRFGAREDWRFADMRTGRGHFWWTSFFTVYLSQQVMLVGLTLPYYAIHANAHPFDWIDGLIAVLALSGVAIAHVADTQLHRFMTANRERRGRGDAAVLILDSGLWRYARHPNYFGEQLFWWAVALWGIRLGMPWTALGAVINTVVLAVVTVMVERRMLARPERADAYRDYQRRTRVWVPLPRLR